MSIIYTYGYAGHTIEEFCFLLEKYNIDLVIDVRTIPLDKEYPDFEKFSLINLLQEKCQKTRYLHFKKLGCSKDIENLRGEELGYLKYFQHYERHLQKHKSMIIELAQEIQGINVCLLCKENNPQTCHRTLIADYLQIQNFTSKIKHLS